MISQGFILIHYTQLADGLRTNSVVSIVPTSGNICFGKNLFIFID